MHQKDYRKHCWDKHLTILWITRKVLKCMLLIPYQEDLRGKVSVEINHIDYIKYGWPEVKAEVRRDIQAYFPFWEELISQNGLIYKGERFVVPTAIRNNLLYRPTTLTLESKDVEEEPANFCIGQHG